MPASVGVRGGSITLEGKGGPYANVWIPGIGIYSKRRIGKQISFSSFEEENSFKLTELILVYELIFWIIVES